MSHPTTKGRHNLLCKNIPLLYCFGCNSCSHELIPVTSFFISSISLVEIEEKRESKAWDENQKERTLRRIVLARLPLDLWDAFPSFSMNPWLSSLSSSLPPSKCVSDAQAIKSPFFRVATIEKTVKTHLFMTEMLSLLPLLPSRFLSLFLLFLLDSWRKTSSPAWKKLCLQKRTDDIRKTAKRYNPNVVSSSIFSLSMYFRSVSPKTGKRRIVIFVWTIWTRCISSRGSVSLDISCPFCHSTLSSFEKKEPSS